MSALGVFSRNRQNPVGSWSQRTSRRIQAQFSPRDPVTIFHHIPKCGGSSFRDVLGSWFSLIQDYRPGYSGDYPPSNVKLSRLRSGHCVVGHFEVDGGYLYQRYPEALSSDRYRIFTVLREPLELRLSLFRFEKKRNRLAPGTLEEHLGRRLNYLAERFPTDDEHLTETLDNYDFVGTLEDPQLTLDVLAWKLGKPRTTLPHVNATQTASNAPTSELSAETIERFREENALDYALYEEAKRRFAETCRAYREATSQPASSATT